MHRIQDDNDWALLFRLGQHDANASEMFYSKYASMMFGCILWICKEDRLASQIFTKIFLNLRSIRVPAPQFPFAFWLWKHTGAETKKIMALENSGKISDDHKEALIESLCFNKLSRDEVSLYFDVNKQDIGQLVKKELQYAN